MNWVKFDGRHMVQNNVASRAKVLAIALQATGTYPGVPAHDLVEAQGFSKQIEWQHYKLETGLHKFYMTDGSICSFIEEAGSWSYTDVKGVPDIGSQDQTTETQGTESLSEATETEVDTYFSQLV